MGRNFKPGWGSSTSLISLTTLWNVDNLRDNLFNLDGRISSDDSPTVVQRLYLYNKEVDLKFKVRPCLGTFSN